MKQVPGVLQPLPGRSCGDCHVCCVELEIDDPRLHKADETPCPHLLPAAGGCGIYQTRPGTCSSWFCGWRLINIAESLRPDRSKVLMIPEICEEPGYRKGGLKFAPVGGDTQSLLQAAVVDLAGRCIAAGVPIFLSCGSGPNCRRLLLNPEGEAIVRAGDLAGFVSMMEDGLRRLADAMDQDSSPVA